MTATLGLSNVIRKQKRKQRNADRIIGITTIRAGVETIRSGTIAIRRETIESIYTSIFNSPAGSPVLPKGQKQKMPRCTPATEVNVYYLGMRLQPRCTPATEVSAYYLGVRLPPMCTPSRG
jgi:hypothetical protein